jgi:putative ABC transport system permease protein
LRPRVLIHFYVSRVRKHPVQELLAGAGIAIGVALVFAVLVANTSITRSAKQTAHDLTGAATLQLVARDTRGFDQSIVARVRRVPGVAQAAPVLEQRAAVLAPGGRQTSLTVVSVDPSVATLSGGLTSDFGVQGLQFANGIVLPGAMARKLGLDRGAAAPRAREHIRLNLRGHSIHSRVAAVLGPETIGSLANSLVAIAPLAYLQRAAGLPGQVTRVLVESQPGRSSRVRAALDRLTDGRVEVASTDADAALLEQATRPNDQATRFFALIAALVGMLLAFNAMLLTAPERRRVIAGLRMNSYRRGQVVVVLLSQALVLGIAASLLGLGVGYLLARSVFDQTPEWLSLAFPLGTQTVVTFGPLAVSFVGGVIATCLAAAPPLFDLWGSRSLDAVYQHRGHPGHGLGRTVRRRMFACSVALMVLSGILLLFGPAAAIVSIVCLVFATVLAVPMTFTAVTAFAEGFVSRFKSLHVFTVAFLSLRATTLTALALAATGAVAVFGAVAIGGARNDLLQGIERFISQHAATAQLWVVNENDNQVTRDFRRGRLPERIGAVPGVTAARSYYGGFLDFAGRRTWVIARPSTERQPIPPRELVHGNLSRANRQLSAAGSVAISDQIAKQLHLTVGDTLRLPTPTGSLPLRIAATTTNLAWSPGAIILNSADYRRGWDTVDPSALEIDVAPGTSVAEVRHRVVAALGPQSSLRVMTSQQRVDQAMAQTRQGLERLRQIATLLLVAAALAMAAAMGAGIWQRRPSLAALRRQTYRPSQLRQVLLVEAVLVLGTGCLAGAVAGVFGQALIDRYLTLATGYSAPFAFDGWQTAQSVLLVVVAALVAVAVPGYLAAQTAPRVGLQE